MASNGMAPDHIMVHRMIAGILERMDGGGWEGFAHIVDMI